MGKRIWTCAQQCPYVEMIQEEDLRLKTQRRSMRVRAMRASGLTYGLYFFLFLAPAREYLSIACLSSRNLLEYAQFSYVGYRPYIDRASRLLGRQNSFTPAGLVEATDKEDHSGLSFWDLLLSLKNVRCHGIPTWESIDRNSSEGRVRVPLDCSSDRWVRK